MVKGRLPYSQDDREGSHPSRSFTRHSQLIFDWVPFRNGQYIHEFQTKSAIVNFGNVDTIITAALSDSDKSTILNWFRRGAPRAASIGMSDFSIGNLEGRVDSNDVSEFFQNCSAGPATVEISHG